MEVNAETFGNKVKKLRSNSSASTTVRDVSESKTLLLKLEEIPPKKALHPMVE
jgi:hypothetical protein